MNESNNSIEWRHLFVSGRRALVILARMYEWTRHCTITSPGLIYGIPHEATFVLIIDPNTDTIDTTTLGGLSPDPSKWWGGVVVPDGRIFCFPRDAEAVLIIDPNTSTLDTTSLDGFGNDV